MLTIHNFEPCDWTSFKADSIGNLSFLYFLFISNYKKKNLILWTHTTRIFSVKMTKEITYFYLHLNKTRARYAQSANAISLKNIQITADEFAKLLRIASNFGFFPTKDIQTPPTPSQNFTDFHERCVQCWIEWKINFRFLFFELWTIMYWDQQKFYQFWAQ